MENLNPSEMIAAASALNADPNSYCNDPVIEHRWAIKAFQHAETYFNLLCALDTKLLKLTQQDDLIYEKFRNEFKDLAVDLIDEDALKSQESKDKWRPFCEDFKGKIEDYNFATLIRIDAKKDYSEENTTIVPRIQFYAIEITRNREGFNSHVKSLFKQASQYINE